MFCPNCGETLSDDAVFCGSCGTQIENGTAAQPTEAPEQQPVQQEFVQQQPEANSNAVSAADIANKAKAVGGEALNKANAMADSATEAVKKYVPGVNKNILLIACAAVLVVIIVLIIIIANVAGGGSSAFTKIPHNVKPFDNDGELAMFIDGNLVTSDADFSYYANYAYLYNANAVVYDEALYKVDGKKLVEVNDDITPVAVSTNINAVVYTTDDGEALYIYKNGKETLIFDDFEGSLATVAVSPNGNTVMFVDRYSDDGEYKCDTYIYRGSKAESFGKNVYPLTVSDDASVIYAYKYSDGYVGSDLYIYKNGKDSDSTKIKADSSIRSISKDAKKILFTTSGTTYYYASNRSDPIKVDGNSISPIYPEYTVGMLDDFKNFLAYEGGSIKRYTLKGDSFEKYTVASSVDSYKLSLDGKKLVYIKNDNLYAVSTTNENADAVKLAEDVYSFKASADLSKIYIIDEDDALVFSNGKSEKTTKIADDVYYRDYVVSSDGVCCYILDDALYTTSGGSKGSKIDKMTDVSDIEIVGGSVFFANNDDVIYLSKNGKSFQKTDIEV